LMLALTSCRQEQNRSEKFMRAVSTLQSNEVATFVQSTGPTNVDEQYKRGHDLINAEHGYRDFPEGALWLRKAAQQGHARAQYELAMLFINGHAKPDYEDEAAKWVRKAADQELPDAEF